MKEKYLVCKKEGETPLEALERLRAAAAIPEDVPMTYAGRLDPMAEGLLLILAGEECKKKDEYTSLEKTYQAKILFGVGTDTYDLLGIPEMGSPSLARRGQGALIASELQITPPQSSPRQGEEENATQGISFPSFMKEEIERWFRSHLGKQLQAYPPYSSKKVDGRQLHAHARAGSEVELPTHEVVLSAYENIEISQVSREAVLSRVEMLAQSVSGDFRQAEIAAAWRALSLPAELMCMALTLRVGSGFYVRGLAEDLGRSLGTRACLHSLVRTRIGSFDLADPDLTSS